MNRASAGMGMFPRLQKRGPIEGAHAFTRSARSRCFHAYKSVAPLKPVGAGARARASPGFHAYKSVAPLKQAQPTDPWNVIEVFPRLQKRGPIEARRATIHRYVAVRVSTLTKAWPH